MLTEIIRRGIITPLGKIMFWKKEEFTDHEILARMREAKQLLDSKLFQESFDILAEKYYQTWMNTKPLDVELREKLYLAQVVLPAVKDHLTMVMNEGLIKESQINQLKGK